MIDAFVEFKRPLRRERQREGIELAKKKRIYKGRKRALIEEDIIQIKKRFGAGENKSSMAKIFGVIRQKIYSYISP